MIKTVGYTKLGYDDVEYDQSGWVDAKKYAPEPFDIVILKTKDKMANGWYEGGNWFSRKLEKNPEVLSWKRTRENFVGGPKDVW